MNVQITAKEAAGKTVKGIYESFTTAAILAFTDGTFIHIRADDGHEPGEVNLTFDTELKPLNFGGRVLIEAGIITSDEYRELEAGERREHAMGERAYYLRLKQKYEIEA